MEMTNHTTLTLRQRLITFPLYLALGHFNYWNLPRIVICDISALDECFFVLVTWLPNNEKKQQKNRVRFYSYSCHTPVPTPSSSPSFTAINIILLTPHTCYTNFYSYFYLPYTIYSLVCFAMSRITKSCKTLSNIIASACFACHFFFCRLQQSEK